MVASTPPSQTIRAFDAKNRLGQVLDRVEAGEELIITRHGAPVARLVPISNRTSDQIEHALATFQRIRQSLTAKGVAVSRDEVRRWRDEGRR